MEVTTTDTELLIQFRDPGTREKAYTTIIKKYQEKLYWHVRRMVVDHDDANDVLQNVFIRVWKALKISGKTPSYIPGFTASPPMNASASWNNRSGNPLFP